MHAYATLLVWSIGRYRTVRFLTRAVDQTRDGVTPRRSPPGCADMQRLALFDLDDTLVDRRRAFRAWAEGFVTARELDDSALSFLLTADAHHSGPLDRFFA